VCAYKSASEQTSCSPSTILNQSARVSSLPAQTEVSSSRWEYGSHDSNQTPASDDWGHTHPPRQSSQRQLFSRNYYSKYGGGYQKLTIVDVSSAARWRYWWEEDQDQQRR
jgi:hypothetical protein